MSHCCDNDESKEEGTWTRKRRIDQFSMRRYANVIEGIVEQVRRREQFSKSKVKIRLFSQAPAHFYSALQQLLSLTPSDVDVIIHGRGDDKSLVSASASAGASASASDSNGLPDFDHMADADVLVIGTGNLSRLAGYLNMNGVVVQLEGCHRSGKLTGDRVVDTGDEMDVDAFNVALDVALLHMHGDGNDGRYENSIHGDAT